MLSNFSDIVDQLCLSFIVCTILKDTRAVFFGDTVRTGSGPFEGVKLENSLPPSSLFSVSLFMDKQFHGI